APRRRGGNRLRDVPRSPSSPTAPMSRLLTTALTLAAVLLPITACAQGTTPARAQAVLDSLVSPSDWLAPDPQPAPAVARGADRGVGTMTVREHEGRLHVYMTQLDSTGRAPAAAVGDTVVA